MSEDDDFAQLKSLESSARSRSDQRSNALLEVLLTDLSFDPNGPLDDAIGAIDGWNRRMDTAIAENLDHESINCFVTLVIKHKREIEMARIARDRHAKSVPAINWVQAEWGRKSSEYRSKKEFGQTYEQLVIEAHPEVKKITWRTISEVWLSGL